MNEDLTERVAIVTGAASGIGLALAESFAADGASLVLADVDGERLEKEAERLRAAGVDVVHEVVDVGDASSVERLAATTRSRFGRADLLCNNAGIVTFGSAWQIDAADWSRTVAVNFLGIVHGISSFVPLMRESGDDGHIVNTASMAAFMQLGSVAPYVATKHAAVGLSIALAEDLRAAGSAISVSVVCPDMVATGMTIPDGDVPKVGDLPGGMISAAAAASAIRTGMASGSFYIFSHAASEETVRDRYARVLDAFDG